MAKASWRNGGYQPANGGVSAENERKISTMAAYQYRDGVMAS
jgi:hypothetical protein